MNTPLDHDSRVDSKTPADEALCESRKNDLDATRPPQQNTERGAEESGQGERGSGLCPLVPLSGGGQTALDGGVPF
jgi:hypothetical protein